MSKEKRSLPAEVVGEYGPFASGACVHGVSFDGSRVWFATGDELRALDASSGEITSKLETPCDAGTAFDGQHLYQLARGRIHKLHLQTGEVLATIPSPAGSDSAGLTWAEGKLWVASYQGRKIYQIEAETGAVVKTVESNRYVTGVTWSEGELWHGTFEDDASELRRVDPSSGEVLESLRMPPGTMVSGLEGDGAGRLYCGGGRSGKLRVVKKPRRR